MAEHIINTHFKGGYLGVKIAINSRQKWLFGDKIATNNYIDYQTSRLFWLFAAIIFDVYILI